MEKKNYITPMGFNRLQTEYDYLKKTERPQVTKLVTWAASLGDRSENADYQYGKKRLREIDRRLRFLARRIHDAQVVNPLDVDGDHIVFGASVALCDEEGKEQRFSVVGVDETNPGKGLISWQSPLGKALLGKQEGDEVLVKAPAGDIEYVIEKIEYVEIFIEEYKHAGPGESESR